MREHYTNPGIRKAIEMLEKMSANEDVRFLVEEREKALRDEAWALASARQEGEQIGLEKGEQIGLEKGEQIGLEKGRQVGGKERAMENARRLLRMNVLTLEQIAEATGLGIDEVTALKKE